MNNFNIGHMFIEEKWKLVESSYLYEIILEKTTNRIKVRFLYNNNRVNVKMKPSYFKSIQFYTDFFEEG